MRFTVAWNDETDRLYFAQHRYDDLFDRDQFYVSPGLCGGDDSFEVHVDADHSGGITSPPPANLTTLTIASKEGD